MGVKLDAPARLFRYHWDMGENTEATGVPDWVQNLWSELRFKEIVGREGGLGFQRLFQQVMKAVDRDDFLDVRPVGRHGDFKCDGWGFSSQTCYAVYGPFSQRSRAAIQRKVAGDFEGAVAAWPDMKNWRLVHNDFGGLSSVVAAVLVPLREEAKSITPNVTLLPPWGPGDLWWMLRQAPAADRSKILGTDGQPLKAPQLGEFADIGDDHVSVSAGQSVIQLMGGFTSGGIVDPLSATDVISASGGQVSVFEMDEVKCCGDDVADPARA
uniref:hypothetical protein n=1 Tax=Actinoplanes rectilineatus TaxID=113571 RepID=UPI000B0D75EC